LKAHVYASLNSFEYPLSGVVVSSTFSGVCSSVTTHLSSIVLVSSHVVTLVSSFLGDVYELPPPQDDHQETVLFLVVSV
jgi:hypothetical protein